MNTIRYKAGYKYQLVGEYSVDTPIRPPTGDAVGLPGDWVTLDPNGRLRLAAGYAWDGPSGPTIDTKNFMRGSLVHDALYQLMRQDLLPQSAREPADELLRTHCREDGMSWVRAAWVYRGVRWGGARAASRDGRRPIGEAP